MRFRHLRKSSMGGDISPLLDCVLLLLIFFMLSSTFVVPGIRLALPHASAADAAMSQDAIVITAAADGQLFVNREPVDLDSLESALRSMLDASSHRAVVFRGDTSIDYGRFVAVLDTARRAGAEHVDVAHAGMTEPEDGP